MQRHLWHLWSKNEFNRKSSCFWAMFLSNPYFQRLTPMHTTSGGLMPKKSSGLWLDAQSSTFQFIIETLTPHVSASIISKVCANKGNSRRIQVEEDGNCYEITNNKISSGLLLLGLLSPWRPRSKEILLNAIGRFISFVLIDRRVSSHVNCFILKPNRTRNITRVFAKARGRCAPHLLRGFRTSRGRSRRRGEG